MIGGTGYTAGPTWPTRGGVVFFPSNLDGPVLQASYRYLWGREVPKGHGAPIVYAAGKEDPLDSYRFFCAYFICGLCPPFSEFFEAIMNIYGFHLLDFTPNAMATMAIFAHLCENFVGGEAQCGFIPALLRPAGGERS